ncbi:hypothetical protein DPX39_070074400 [Trypanosoma brucei equiperdum]|uniref:Uncharacterized protein n=1 Tax=Trypanosoma brucei equiperdum TaxID=630700 RepID=A0A3L6L4W0_9TRYP|nr:hypothetical protein DPX39_070074400 [Trypanosoma brucei equiperdum]
MRYMVFAALLLLVPFLQVTEGLSTIKTRPQGPYCGDYFSIVEGRVDFPVDLDTFDISLTISGDVEECKNEPYVYDEVSGNVELTNAQDPGDCLGSILRRNQLTLMVTYHPDDDEISLDFGIAVVNLSPCP